jgi:hypothetical protein
MIVHLRFMLYCMFTNPQVEGEGVVAAAPRPKLLVTHVVDPRIDKAGAIPRPKALSGAQGDVPSAWSFYPKEVRHCEVLPTLMDLHTYLNEQSWHTPLAWCEQ